MINTNKLEIKKTALEIIDALCDKKCGFDDWWWSLDTELEGEIIILIENIIEKRLQTKQNK